MTLARDEANSRGGGFEIKDGINEAGRKGKVLVRQRIIAGFDPSRPSQASDDITNKVSAIVNVVSTFARADGHDFGISGAGVPTTLGEPFQR